MSGFNLLDNYTENPEALLRKKRSHTSSSSATLLASEPITPVPSATTAMAKTLHDYSNPVVANVPVEPAVNTKTGNFKLRTDLITMVQANQLCGLPSEDASAHLQHFLELCDQRRRTSLYQALSVSQLSLREGQTVVLQGE